MSDANRARGAAPLVAAPAQVAADDGFFFGVGAFETIAVAAGQPLLLDAHLARLQRTCAYLGIDVDADMLDREVRERATAPEMADGRWAMKLTVTPENRLITVRPNPYGPESYERGYSLVTSAVRCNEGSPLTAMKTLCHADCILAKRAAQAAGFDEPVLLNNRGELAEGATTNLF
ncbi:MAG: aminotransferase class IV, partial [Coriobacteriaceae bacterium]|nr:aminotransferase class IV [Coriobacteriaceae bacterium]